MSGLRQICVIRANLRKSVNLCRGIADFSQIDWDWTQIAQIFFLACSSLGSASPRLCVRSSLRLAKLLHRYQERLQIAVGLDLADPADA